MTTDFSVIDQMFSAIRCDRLAEREPGAPISAWLSAQSVATDKENKQRKRTKKKIKKEKFRCFVSFYTKLTKTTNEKKRKETQRNNETL